MIEKMPSRTVKIDTPIYRGFLFTLEVPKAPNGIARRAPTSRYGTSA